MKYSYQASNLSINYDLLTQTNTNNTSSLNIALYSHDTMGLGHIRRNMAIASAIKKSMPKANILLISGVTNAVNMHLPQGIDFVSLPSVQKNIEGKYAAKNLTLPLEKLISIRTQIILSTIKSFEPDIFIVDNVPRGVQFELDETLEYLRTNSSTRIVLGLRDILDEHEQVRKEWSSRDNERTISNFYDQVWVYGDPDFFNPIKEYRFNSISTITQFTGYLSRACNSQVEKTVTETTPKHAENKKKSIVCLVGGGQDGELLANCFALAELPENTTGILLTGPFFPEKQKSILLELCENNDNIQIIDSHNDPTQLIKNADKVIAMCGYNTASEILSFSKPALFIPRVAPRQEQNIRAKLLQKKGIADYLHPMDLVPDKLTVWMKNSRLTSNTDGNSSLNFDGYRKIPELVSHLVANNKFRPFFFNTTEKL